MEEHIWTPDIRDALAAADDPVMSLTYRFPAIDERLRDLGDGRLRRMNSAGVDAQVLSVTTPGVQTLGAVDAVPLARDANDVLIDTVRRHPDRFTAFATLPTPDPEAAEQELRRVVSEPGMVGALVFPWTGDRPLDHPSLRPVIDTAADLRVPLYIHPQFPPRAVRDIEYSGFAPAVNEMLATGGWGWHAEAGVAALRLILAGTFDRHPDLQVILGHWGEMLVSFLERADALTGAATDLERSVAEVISSNVVATAGGIYSQRMLQTTVTMLGADRVLMAVDDPFHQQRADGEARDFVLSAALSLGDRAKIAHLNAERLGLAPACEAPLEPPG